MKPIDFWWMRKLKRKVKPIQPKEESFLLDFLVLGALAQVLFILLFVLAHGGF